MAKQGEVRTSRHDLVEALESGQLPDTIAAQGRGILDRMEKPLRVSILGLSGTGKTTLMNLLLGATVVPDSLDLPTLSIVYGDDPCARCTLADGEVQTMALVDMKAIVALKPAFIELEMPLPALRKISVMEVVAGEAHQDQMRAVQWASKRTDIALWCTQSCTPEEEAMWSMLPDHVQDHSFLLLTKADQLAADGTMSEMAALANDAGAESFRKVMPLDVKSALAARGSDGTVDKKALRASGGLALISVILGEVEEGQRAASDEADVFLRQIDFTPATAPAQTPAPLVLKEPVTAEVVAPKLKAVETPAPVKKPAPAVAKVAPVEVEAPKIAAVVVDLPVAARPPANALPTKIAKQPMSEHSRAICNTAIDQLIAEGVALSLQLESGDIEPATVVSVSAETVIWLADYLVDNELPDEPALLRASAAATEAADLVQLIQLETGDGVALDALNLMIQLKHEIQSELAA